MPSVFLDAGMLDIHDSSAAHLQGLKGSSESVAHVSRLKDLSLDGPMEDLVDDLRNRGEEPFNLCSNKSSSSKEINSICTK